MKRHLLRVMFCAIKSKKEGTFWMISSMTGCKQTKQGNSQSQTKTSPRTVTVKLRFPKG